MKKATSGILGVITLTSILSGCGNSVANQKGSNTTGANNQSSSKSSTQSKVDIVYATTSPISSGMTTLVNNFEQLHPNIHVKLEGFPFASYDSTIETQLRAGAGPDVLYVNFVDLATWKDAGYLQNISPMMKASGRSSKGYANFYHDGTFASGQYGLPYSMDVRALYYNKSVFQKYNLTPPTDWNQLLADAKVLKAHGIYGLSADMESNWNGVWEDDGNFLLSNGGKILNKTGTKAIAAQDPNTVQAYEFFWNKLAPYFPPGISSITHTTDEKLFASGKLAMFESGPWFAPAIKKDNPNMVYGKGYGIVPLPKSPYTGKSISASGGGFLGISKHSNHQQAAWELMNYLTQEKNATAIALAANDMPTWVSAWKQKPWNTPFYQAFYKAMPTGASPIYPLVPQLSAVTTALWKQLQLIASGSETVQQGLTKFDTQANGLLQFGQ